MTLLAAAKDDDIDDDNENDDGDSKNDNDDDDDYDNSNSSMMLLLIMIMVMIMVIWMIMMMMMILMMMLIMMMIVIIIAMASFYVHQYIHTYSIYLAKHYICIPKDIAASAILSISRFLIIHKVAPFMVPTIFSLGMMTSLNTNSAVIEARIPHLSLIF